MLPYVMSKPNSFLSVFDDIFDLAPSLEYRGTNGAKNLAVDLVSKDSSYLMTADVPGVNKEDLEILVEGETLTLKVSSKKEKSENNTNYLRRERSMSSCTRTFKLPGLTGNPTASLKDGVLTIEVPKTPEKVVRKLEIT